MGEAGAVTVTFGDDVAVVSLTGEHDFSTLAVIQGAINRCEHARLVLVDLACCDFMDSTALRAVVTGWKRVGANGGELACLSPSTQILQMMRLTGFDALLLPDRPLAEDGAALDLLIAVRADA